MARQIKIIEKNELAEVFKKLKNDPDSVKGIVYNYGDFLIYVKNKIPATVNERYKKIYYKRRNSGICVRCSKPAEINPNTKKAYRFCEEHRKEES